MGNILITKIGAGIIAGILVVGFAVQGFETYIQTKVISTLQQPVVVKTVVVTPTNVPTATPSATLNLKSVNGKVVLPTGLTRIGVPASATKVLTK